MSATLSAGALREALIGAMDLGGAWGQNLGESKDVLLRIGDTYYPLAKVSVAFVAGRFALVLTGDLVKNGGEENRDE